MRFEINSVQRYDIFFTCANNFLHYTCIFDKKVVPLQVEIVCIYTNE